MSRNNYIFVDFENVQEADLDHIAGKPVKVVFVLGDRQKKLPLTLIKLIKKYSAQVELVETALHGKNALDFVLAYEIGIVSSKEPEACFYIVSRDQGFNALIMHLKAKGIPAALYGTFSEIPVFMNSKGSTSAVCVSVADVKISSPPKPAKANPATERGKQVAAMFKANPKNRPKKLESLAAVIRVRFGEKLSADELKQTIHELIRMKVITLSKTGEVAYIG